MIYLVIQIATTARPCEMVIRTKQVMNFSLFKLLFLSLLANCFLVFLQPIQAQKPCLPNSPLVIEAGQMEVSTLAAEIRSKKARFTAVDIAGLNLSVATCNSEVEKRISTLRNGLLRYSTQRQDLYGLRDAEGIRKQIEEKKKAQEDIRSQMLLDLQGIQIQGLYIVYADNVDAFSDSKESLMKQSDAWMAPKVIEEQNGIFLESATIVKDAQLVYDYIRTQVSGELTVAPQKTSINPEAAHFVNLTLTTVSALRRMPDMQTSQNKSTARNYRLINVLQSSDFASQLRSWGVSETVIADMNKLVELKKESILQQNQLQLERQQRIMREGQMRIQQAEAEITQLETSLKERDARVLTFLKKNPDVTVESTGNTDEQIKKILGLLDSRIQNTMQEINREKEQELIAKMQVKVPFEGNAAEDIARKAMDVYEQLKSAYGKVENYYEQVEVENGILKGQEQRKSRDLYRTPDKIWLYPVPLPDDEYTLSMVISFNIIEKKEEPKPVQNTSTQQSANANTLIASNGLQIDPSWPAPIQDLVRDMVKIPAGKFKIGSRVDEIGRDTDEGPLTEITLNSFYMGKYEVTLSQFIEFVSATGYKTDAEKKESKVNYLFDVNGNRRSKVEYNHPVSYVSWHDAEAFTRWVSEFTGISLKLPSESQWEYACRAGSTTPFNTGDCLSSNEANYDGNYPYQQCAKGNYKQSNTPVGSYKANAWGLYDMHGNLSEWCLDVYHYSYSGIPLNGNPWVGAEESTHIKRGGNSNYYAENCRSAYRGNFIHISKHLNDDSNNGFRLVHSTPNTIPNAPIKPVEKPQAPSNSGKSKGKLKQPRYF